MLDSILQKIYAATGAPPQAVLAAVAAQGAAPAPQRMDPATNAPLPTAVVAPTQAQNPSIMGAIGRILAPEAGSFWHSAWNNGLANAHEGQDAYPQQQATRQALQAATVQEAQRKAARKYDVVGNAVVTQGADGQPEFTTAPTEQERIIERWASMDDKNPLKKMLERSIKGFQYSQDYLDDKAEAGVTQAEGAAKAKARYPTARVGGTRGGGAVSATARAKYIKDAEEAIANGAPRAAVYERLAKMGVR